MYNCNQIKQIFIDYFISKDHIHVKGSSVIPQNDDTLLFTNAGMNQFKSIFLGDSTKLKSVCNSQNCIRAGGKHNDLDDVGKDNYHHTFFEMLGSWSFNSYQKQDAIDYVYDLIVNVYGIDKDRLYITYFEGDDQLGIDPDIETKELWAKYFDESKIIKGDAKDNFWMMGSTGPCGPCTEIHYDKKGSRDASLLVNKDDPTVVEVWNIVFIQYNKTDDKLLTLDKKFIDTGMGFERLVSIIQNKESNYDTDIFIPLIEFVEDKTKLKYENKYDKKDTAFRVLVDHLRTICIAINDGCIPGPNGREYVIRRMIRRINLYATYLNYPRNFLTDNIDDFVDLLLTKFPDLDKEQICQKVKDEDKQYLLTVGKGVKLCKKYIKNSINIMSGKDIFTLYTTFGFPLELTQIMCDNSGLSLDIDEYNRLMDIHIKVSKNL